MLTAWAAAVLSSADSLRKGSSCSVGADVVDALRELYEESAREQFLRSHWDRFIVKERIP